MTIRISKDPQENWENNDIQFPRLLAEIMGTLDFTNEQWEELCASMDLAPEEIMEVFERAMAVWDRIKQHTAAELRERERGEDDGLEYGDPRDAMDERLED